MGLKAQERSISILKKHSIDFTIENTQLEVEEVNEKDDDKFKNQNTEEVPNIMYFLRQREILVNLILMTIVWVSTTFCYYLLNFHVKYLPGDFSINAFVV